MSYRGLHDGFCNTNYRGSECGIDRGDSIIYQSHSPKRLRKREAVQSVSHPVVPRIHAKDHRNNDEVRGGVQGVKGWIKMKNWFERKLEESKQRRAEQSRLRLDAATSKTRKKFHKVHEGLDGTLDSVISDLRKKRG